MPHSTPRRGETCARKTYAPRSKAAELPKKGSPQKASPFKVYNIVDGIIEFEYRPQYIAADIHQGSCRKSITIPGDVLMNIVGPPLGKIAVVPQGVDEWNINQAITLFRPSESISSAWIHLVLLEELTSDESPKRPRGQLAKSTSRYLNAGTSCFLFHQLKFRMKSSAA